MSQLGELKIDYKKLKPDQLRAWQNNAGFVPQSIFLADASIKENIDFGISEDEIDINCVYRASRMSNLDELLKELPDGIETRVGERGAQLSGGQRQRIDMARALYDLPVTGLRFFTVYGHRGRQYMAPAVC